MTKGMRAISEILSWEPIRQLADKEPDCSGDLERRVKSGKHYVINQNELTGK